MFEDCLVESAGKIKTKKSRTVAISATLHGLLIAVLILGPLVFTDQIEGARLTSILLEPPPPPPAPPPAAAVSVARPAVREVPQIDPKALIEPLAIPKEIAMIVDPADSASSYIGVPSGPRDVIGGKDFPNLNRLINGPEPPHVAAPPPPPPAPPPPPPVTKRSEPQRIGGEVQQGKLIYHPTPAYPSLARTARIEGSVVMQATIAEDGTIQSLRIIAETSPLLHQGVIETVKTWKYKPTLLNNEPVEVLTTITINFNLHRDSQ